MLEADEMKEFILKSAEELETVCLNGTFTVS